MGISYLVSRQSSQVQSGLFFKIQYRKFSIEFPRSAIVGFSGLNLIIKIADLFSFVIDPNRGSPFSRLFVVPDAPVF